MWSVDDFAISLDAMKTSGKARLGDALSRCILPPCEQEKFIQPV